MRAIEYGLKTFGGYSLLDHQTNITVFNENIIIENPDQIKHYIDNKLLVECVFNGSVFEIKENGDAISAEEFAYLIDTEVEPIETFTISINLPNIGQVQRKLYKIKDQFFVFINYNTGLDFGELDSVTIKAEKGKKKIIKSKPVLLSEKLRENKQSIIIFISSNGTLIENAYKNINQIRDNELVFFIEDKQDSNIFGSVVRILSGKGFNSLRNIPFREISKVVNVCENSIRPVDFEYMLKDHFANKESALYLVKRFFLGMLSEVIIIKNDASLTAIEFLANGISEAIAFFQAKDSRWRYYDDEGNKLKYNNILIPLDFLDTEKVDKKTYNVYGEELKRIENEISKILKTNEKIINENKIFKKIVNRLLDVLDTITDFVNNPFQKGLEITKNTLIFYNALVIGLINGFLEAVKGFFDLIALLAKGLKYLYGEAKAHAASYWIMFFESIENFYDLMTNLITVKNLVRLIDFYKKCLLLTPLIPYMAVHYFLDADMSITADSLGYYLGFAVGTIFQIILEVLLTGGAKTMAEAAELLFIQMQNLFKGITKTTLRAGENFVANLVEGIIKVYAKMKHIAKNFDSFITELEKLIIQWLLKLEDFLAIFGKETLALFSKHGVDIRKVPQAALYAGIPIPVGDNVYALMRDGREIFRGTKAEVNDFANHLKKMSDAEAKKFLDELVKGNKLKLAEKMWAEFTYEHLMKIPPTKKPCFLAGTLVKTENGHLPIEQIKVGNNVFTYNLEKKQTELNTVSRVYENVTQKYLKIKAQNSCIEATGQHRFWIPKQEKWLMANELKTGMYFLDVNKNEVEILNLEIIENPEKTYNLEIENNHNYFVGQDEILTHNTNKVFKFADETLYDFGFYLLAETDAGRVKSELYVGITTQPFDVRNSQHAQEGKAALPPKNQKPYNAWKAKIGTGEVSIFGIKPGYTKMTFYEATVWETYFINERGGGKAHKGLGKLLNRKTPISEKMFNDMKKTGKFNPCKYFI